MTDKDKMPENPVCFIPEEYRERWEKQQERDKTEQELWRKIFAKAFANAKDYRKGKKDHKK